MGIGLLEISIGGIIFWFMFWKSGSSPDEDTIDTTKEVEIRRIMEDIRTTGGVDPRLMSDLHLKITMLGTDPKTIITNPKDELRTLAEMIYFLKTYRAVENERKIVPPPAPNSLRAVNQTRELLVESNYPLQGPTSSGTGAIYVNPQ